MKVSSMITRESEMTITIKEWNEGSEEQRRQWLAANVLIQHQDIRQLEWQIRARETRKLRPNWKRSNHAK